MFKKSNLNSKKFSNRKKIIFLIKAGLVLFLVGMVVFGIRLLFQWEKISISNITVSGNHVLESSDIVTFSENEIKGNYYGLFSKANIFFYPKKKIENGLKKQWARIDKVSIENSDLTSLKIEIVERKPKFLWCGNENAFKMANPECYYMNDGGYVFGKSPEFSSNVYFRFFGNISAADPIEESYMNSELFGKISSLIIMFEKADLDPQNFIAKAGGEFELYLKSGVRVLFNEKNDFEKIYDNLVTFMESDVIKKEIKNSSMPIDYLDLRYGNKIFYKFKQ